MHSLVSSLSNIVYSISTERDNRSTIDCVEDCLLSAFPRRNNNKEPDLNKIIVGFDRGYNGFLLLVAFILKCGGNTFGTSKRALHNVYTYDQKKRDWDRRIFKSKEGDRLCERMSCPIKDTNSNKVGELTSLFYRNGFGGAILMQSTLPEHQVDTWDRVLTQDRVTMEGDHSCYYKPHRFFSTGINEETIRMYQNEISTALESKILLITVDQNVPEWFISRMFCLTASPAGQYISIGLKDKSNFDTLEWVAVKNYATNEVTSTPTPIITTYSEELNNATDWARHMFDDIDGDEWLRNPVNLKELEGQATTNKDYMKKWRAIQKEFQGISNHTRGYTTVSPDTISHYLSMTEDNKILFDLDTSDKLRKRLRERVPKQSALFKTIKNLNGKIIV
jgi:hypothetical protein